MDAPTTASSLLLAALVSLVCCYRLISYYYRLETNAVVPREWPVLGHLVPVIANIHRLHDWVTGCLAAQGHNFELRGGVTGVRYLCTCDPSNVRHIFTSNFANYPKGDHFAKILDLLGRGILTADGDSWRYQRTMIQTLFSGSRFRAFAARCSRDEVEESLLPLLADAADAGRSCDLQDVFLRLSSDVSCGIVLGVDPGCLAPDLPEVPFSRAVDDASETFFLRHVVPAPWWKLMRRLGVGSERKMAAARKTIDGFVAEAIAQRRRRTDKLNGDSADDLLSSFLCHDDNFSDDFLRDMTVTLLIAGRDGTGVTLSWFFYLLSKNPRVEQRLLHELSLLIASRRDDNNKDTVGGFVSFDASELGSLVYLHAALCECLRLYPAIPFEHKSAVADDVLPSGHKVKAGETVLVFNYSMGRMEGVWGKDCTEFVPERWITQDGKLRYEPSYKFFAFNTGPRTCLGKDLAFVQMKTAAAAVLWNFAVEVVPEHVVQPKLAIILYMKNGLAVRVTRRNYVVLQQATS
ncbi:hypothetical protein EJB05_40625, partial [Eragrostis curvula]